MVIPDINVLLYAVDGASPCHKPCIDWLNTTLNSSEEIGFSWHVITGFARLGTNPKVATRPMTIAEAFGYLESWLSRPLCSILVPKHNHLTPLRRLLEQVGTAGNLTSDAHLAALAMDYDGQIVSCDNDFARFAGIRQFNPVPSLRSGS